jgi:hypothetical protein
MKVLLGTPNHGGQVHLGYHESIIRLLAFFRDNFPNIEFETRHPVCSMVTFARNVLASLVLNDRSYTHLLFIDSDMVFSPSLIARMIAFNKPVVGCICPMRSFDYTWYHASGIVHQDPMVARLLAATYIGAAGLMTSKGPNGDAQTEVVDGFVRAHYGGSGIMLIRRDVFEQLKQRYPELWVEKTGSLHRAFGLNGGVLQCFECVQAANGIYIGEDVSFCARWVNGCGGELWTCVDEVVGHVGQENFLGQYLLKMQKGESLFSMPSVAEAMPPAAATRSPANTDRPAAP